MAKISMAGQKAMPSYQAIAHLHRTLGNVDAVTTYIDKNTIRAKSDPQAVICESMALGLTEVQVRALFEIEEFPCDCGRVYGDEQYLDKCCECGATICEVCASYNGGRDVCDQCYEDKQMEDTYNSMRGREV